MTEREERTATDPGKRPGGSPPYCISHVATSRTSRTHQTKQTNRRTNRQVASDSISIALTAMSLAGPRLSQLSASARAFLNIERATSDLWPRGGTLRSRATSLVQPVPRVVVVLAARGKGSKSGAGSNQPIAMRGVKKENLPTKTCVVCERPFTWRKKWERCWDEVTTCSKSCNAARRRANKGRATNDGGDDDDDDEEEEEEEEEEFGRGGTGDGSGSAREAARAARKANKKAVKAAKRVKRGEGGGVSDDDDPPAADDGKKRCDGCGKPVDLLIRCQVDASRRWRMLCGGKCWKDASGGIPDGDANHPHYRYGGLWKNRRAGRHVSTAVPKLGDHTVGAVAAEGQALTRELAELNLA